MTVTTARLFEGADYQPARDNERLLNQLERVYAVLKDGKARTLPQIQGEIKARFDVDDPAPSISAQIRHLRKSQFGSHLILRTHVGNGLYDYRLCRSIITAADHAEVGER